MSPLPDIEKTTISVANFARSMWAVCILGISGTWLGAASWYQAQNRLSNHDEALAQIRHYQEEEKANQQASQLANQQLSTQMLTVSQQVAGIEKRMDDYRPFKWSTPMQIEYTEQLQQRNPALLTPDAQAIHDKALPFTP